MPPPPNVCTSLSTIAMCELFLMVIHQMMCAAAELTCMTVGDPARFPESKAVWAEVEDEVVVVWKRPEPQVDQITEFIHGFDVCICSTEMKMWTNINSFISSTHAWDSWGSEEHRIEWWLLWTHPSVWQLLLWLNAHFRMLSSVIRLTCWNSSKDSLVSP